MKTISLKKKVAAVAVASLGLGLLSVVPAKAATTAVTTVLGTITPADGSAIVGSTVSIPMGLTTGAVDTITSFTATATFAQLPVNSARTDSSISATTVGNDTEFGSATAATNVIGSVATANAIAYTSTNSAAANTNKRAGTFSFVPDVPGIYQVTIAIPAGTNTGTITTTATTAITIIVGGAQLTQASSGKGTATGTAVAGGSAVVKFQLPGATAAGQRFNVTSTGVGGISNPQDCATDDATLVKNATVVRCAAGGTTSEGFINGTNSSDGLFFTNTTLNAGNVLIGPAATATVTFDAGSNVAGTQTITITSIALATGIPTTVATVTITWGSAPALSVGTTTSILNAGTGTGAGSDTTSNLVSKSATGQQFNIVVTVRDGNALALNGQTVSATIAGPGLISVAAGNAGGAGTGRAGSVTLNSTSNVAAVGVNADGTSGTGTITILVGSTVVATETVLFYDDPSKVEAKQLLKVGTSAGGTLGLSSANPTGADVANTPAVIVTVTDKNGFRIPSLAKTTNVTLVSSNPLAFSTDFDWTQSDGTGLANTVTRTYNVAVKPVASASGSTSKLKFRVALTATTFVDSNELTFATGGGIASVSLGLDKATYALGAPAVATITAKDSAGNAPADSDYTNILQAALTSSLAVNKTLFGTTVSTVGGVSTVEFNAPTVTNSAWTISGTTGTGPSTTAEKNKAISTSAAISGSAEIAAVDAKISALVAAIAKLQKAINKINKRLNR